MLIAIIIGGGVLGLAKLFPVSFWGFIGFFVVVLLIGMALRLNHKRTASARRLSYKLTAQRLMQKGCISLFKNTFFVRYLLTMVFASVILSRSQEIDAEPSLTPSAWIPPQHPP